MRLLLLFILAWQVSVATAAPELKGQWKSNRELTIATFSLPDSMSEDVRERWCNLYGQMIVTYNGRECSFYWPPSFEFGESSDRLEYRVEIETREKLIIVTTDPDTGEVTKETLHFVSPDRYYVAYDIPKEFPALYGAREYFDRVDVFEN